MSDSACFVSGIGGVVNDYVPVVITGIDVLELDTDLIPIRLTPIRGSFGNGDAFSYTASDEENTVKGAIQLNILGVNQLDETIQNVFVISFSNECGVSVVEVGDVIGWVVVVS